MSLYKWVQVAGAAAVLVTGFPFSSPAAAQTIRVSPGDSVSRIDTSGREAGGIVRGIDPSALTVRVRGVEQQWTLAETRELWRHGDSLLNGSIVGALVGFGAGVYGGYALAAIAEGDVSDVVSITAPLGALAGAGLGAVIDASHRGRSLLFRQAARRFDVAPVLRRGTRGVHVAIRF